jgi:glycosyltransferase involved in cell wall biosynthesis
LGVDTTRFRPVSDSKEGFIIGLGAFVPEKNIALVIQALGAIPENRPRLVWVGNVAWPEHLSALEQMATKLGVDFEPRTKVGDDELVKLLSRAVMMVYAPRLEPFGLAPLEANACGTPIVAVAEGGVRETVLNGVNGLLVEHEPQAMAAAIEKLLGDRDYARHLGRSCRELVMNRWSLDAAIDRLEERLVEAVEWQGTGFAGC